MTPLGESPKDLPMWKMMLAGGCAGVAYWTIMYPVDVVKTRVQVDPVYCTYSFVRALREQFREGGWHALYRGYSLTALRSFPSNGAIFYVYSLCSGWMLHGWDGRSSPAIHSPM